MSGRVSQVSAEVLTRALTSRMSQVNVEVLGQEQVSSRVSQVASEVLQAGALTRMTQMSVEVLSTSRAALPCEPLPAWIAFGATGGPEYGISVFSTPGGWEQRVAHWSQVRGRWDISMVNRSAAEMAELLAFFRAVAHGQVETFCFQDRITPDYHFDNQIAVGDGTTTVFPLLKVYRSGTYTTTRPLTRPVATSLQIWINGVPTTAYSLEPSGGEILFTVPPVAGAQIWARGEFEVLVRFDTDNLVITCVAPGIFSVQQLGLLEVVGE